MWQSLIPCINSYLPRPTCLQSMETQSYLHHGTRRLQVMLLVSCVITCASLAKVARLEPALHNTQSTFHALLPTGASPSLCRG